MRAAQCTLALVVLASIAVPMAQPVGAVDPTIQTPTTLAVRVNLDIQSGAIVGAPVFIKRISTEPRQSSVIGADGVARFAGLTPGLYQAIWTFKTTVPHAVERVLVRPGREATVTFATRVQQPTECDTADDGYDDTPLDRHVGMIRGRKVRLPFDRGALYGVVRDAGGNPLAAARVHLRSTMSDRTEDRRTDLTGEFGIGDLPAGAYDLETRSAGYEPDVRRVVVPGGQQVNLLMSLAVGRGPITAPTDAGSPDQIATSIETGFGDLLVGFDRSSAAKEWADILSTHDFDDGSLVRIGAGEFALSAAPYYSWFSCGWRMRATGAGARLQLRIDETQGISIVLGNHTLTGRVLEGDAVVSRLLKYPIEDPVVVIAVSTVERLSRPAAGPLAFFQDPARSR